MLRFWRATVNSRNGLAFAIRSEQAIREELVAIALALPLAWLIGVPWSDAGLGGGARPNGVLSHFGRAAA